jgi:hypothetical protein
VRSEAKGIRDRDEETSSGLQQYHQHWLRSAKADLGIEVSSIREIYQYFDVPAAEHAAFLAAESKRTYLNQQFKRRGYRYQQIPTRSK